jgi:1,4-alpha-glucan branching enzyme
VLPISHDEVVHGKLSFLDRMPGHYEQKFAGERVFYAWQMTHPGKKLSFMGNEIGQFREWDYEGQIEWFLLQYDMHAAMQRYYAALNHLYLEHPALWACDDSWDGMAWIDADNASESVYSYRRIDPKTKEEIVVVLNFTPVLRRDFYVGVAEAGEYEEIFNSDAKEFGGGGLRNENPISSEEILCFGLPHRIRFDLPPMSAVLFRRVPTKKTRKKNPKT